MQALALHFRNQSRRWSASYPRSAKTVAPFRTTGSRHCLAWEISASFPPETVMRTGRPAPSQTRFSLPPLGDAGIACRATIQPAFRAPDRSPAAGVFFTPFAAIRWVLLLSGFQGNPCRARHGSRPLPDRWLEQSPRRDHQRAKIGVFLCQCLEYPLEHTRLRPALVTIVEGLGCAVFSGNVAPAITALKAENDPRQDFPIIGSRHAARLVRK